MIVQWNELTQIRFVIDSVQRHGSGTTTRPTFHARIDDGWLHGGTGATASRGPATTPQIIGFGRQDATKLSVIGLLRVKRLASAPRAQRPPVVAKSTNALSLSGDVASCLLIRLQPGSPAKAAKAIVDAVAAGAPSLRLPLGADAIESIRGKLIQVGADVDASESVARATAF